MTYKSVSLPTELIALEAAADLSAKQYHAIKVDSNAKGAVSGAGEQAVGILQDDPAAGEIGTVMTLGISKAKYGASVTAGQNLASDANGKFVPATGNDAVICVALESGSADEIRSVLLVTRVSAGARTNSIMSIPVKLAKITAAGDVVTNYTPGFAGVIKKISFVVTDPVTTAAKAADLNLEIGSTNVTGGVVSLTSANCTPLGAVIDGSAITAGNAFDADDTISVEAANVTAFAEGEGVLLIVLG